jgi:hypothetical protein
MSRAGTSGERPASPSIGSVSKSAGTYRFGQGRWIEVTPPGRRRRRRDTDLAHRGVDTGPEPIHSEGVAPTIFVKRDLDGTA